MGRSELVIDEQYISRSIGGAAIESVIANAANILRIFFVNLLCE